jgi:hypothetical protein
VCEVAFLSDYLKTIPYHGGRRETLTFLKILESVARRQPDGRKHGAGKQRLGGTARCPNYGREALMVLDKSAALQPIEDQREHGI